MASGLSPPDDPSRSQLSRISDDSNAQGHMQTAMVGQSSNVGAFPFLVVQPGANEQTVVSTPGNSSDSFSSGHPMQVDISMQAQSSVSNIATTNLTVEQQLALLQQQQNLLQYIQINDPQILIAAT